MHRRKTIATACLAVAAMLLLPADALAHKKLPVGKYYCYYWSGTSFTYSTFDLKIKRDKKYVFLQGKNRVGAAGSFKHTSDTERVRFTSGYLANKNFKGKHGVSQDGHTVRLTKQLKDGSTFSYSCAD